MPTPIVTRFHQELALTPTLTRSPRSSAPDEEGDEDGDRQEDHDLDLMYDPILNCYYDPKTNKYYELAP